MPRRRIYRIVDCDLMNNPTVDECRLCEHYKGNEWGGIWINCNYEVIPKEPETDEEYTEKW